MLASNVSIEKRPAPLRRASSKRASQEIPSSGDLKWPSSDIGELSLPQLQNDSVSPFKASRILSPRKKLRSRAASIASPSKPLAREQLTKKSRDELERLLVAADEIIKNREQELAISARVGQQLLEHKNELKGKYDALAQKLSTKDPAARLKTPSLILSPSVAEFIGSHAGQREEWETEDDSLESSTATIGFSPSMMAKRRARNRTLSSMRSSSISSNLSLSDVISPVKHRRSSTDMETLSAINAELSARLEALEAEAASNEFAGNKRMRKLTKEIANLQEECQQALVRNMQLEDQLQLKTLSSSGSSTPTGLAQSLSSSSLSSSASSFRITAGSKRNSLADRIGLEQIKEIEFGLPSRAPSTDNDGDQDESWPLPSRPASFTNNFEPFDMDRKQIDLIAALRAKIGELEDANTEMASDRQQLQTKLNEAETDLQSLQDLTRQETLGKQRQSTVTPSVSNTSIASMFSTSTYSPSQSSKLRQASHADEEFDMSPDTSPLSTKRWSKQSRTLGSEIGQLDMHDDALFEATINLTKSLATPSPDASVVQTLVRRPTPNDMQVRSREASFEYEHLSMLEMTQTSDYWPVALLARYRPRMLADRLLSRSLAMLFRMVSWVQFSICLGIAVYAVLKQGPKKMPRRQIE